MQVGDRVTFSAVGAARVQGLPEAWGLHRALLEGLGGVVTEVEPGAGPEGEAQVCVEFPTGAAHYWEAECFTPAETSPHREVCVSPEPGVSG